VLAVVVVALLLLAGAGLLGSLFHAAGAPSSVWNALGIGVVVGVVTTYRRYVPDGRR
jgi:hypothetical protein